MDDMKLLHGDCLELMKEIPDESVDMILTDPPYLMSYKTNHRADKSHRFCQTIIGDNDKELIADFAKEAYRVLKNNTAMYCFCNSNHVDFFKEVIESAGFRIKNILIWVKNNWTAGDLKAQYGKQYEMIIYCNKGRKFIQGKRLTDVWYFDRVSSNRAVHQNQKPVDLLTQIIEKSSDVGDVILDPFMGSGSTGIACMNTRRKFIGMEIDEEYFTAARERIQQERAQVSIFDLLEEDMKNAV